MQFQQARRMATFGVAVLFLGFMALKDSPNIQLYQGADKLYHLAGFSVLSYMACVAFPKARLGALFVWILMGAASIELLQALTPSRSPSLADMTVNIVGIMIGLGASQLTRGSYREPPKRKRSSRGTRRRTGKGYSEGARSDDPNLALSVSRSGMNNIDH